MSRRSQEQAKTLLIGITSLYLLQMCLLPNQASASEATNPSTGPPSSKSRKPHWEYVGLDVEITVEPGGALRAISGKASLRLLEDSSSGPVLYLNAAGRELQFTRATAKSTPKEIALEINLDWVDTQHVVQVLADRPFHSGEVITLDFAVEPSIPQEEPLAEGRILVGFSHKPWYPFLDTSSQEDSTLTVPLTMGRTILHLPPGWTAIASGTRQERVETAQGVREAWITGRPTRRSFCAGKFSRLHRVVEGRQVDFYLLDAAPQDIADPISMVGSAINVLESRLGSLGDTLWTVVEVPNDFGESLALAETGYIVARSAALTHAGGNLPLFAHELAHSWWGDHVRPAAFEDLFCSEALSQYFAAVAIEDVLGEREATEFLRWSSMGFDAYSSARGYFALVAQDLDMPLSSAPTRDLLYSKGPWVLRMLRDLVGDVVFFDTLRSILRVHAHGKITLDQFREHFVKASADSATVRVFFEQWLDRVGAPTLTMNWRALRDSTDGIRIFVQQSQVAAPFQFELDIGIVAEGGIVVHRVPIQKMFTKLELGCVGAPSMVILDPRHRLLLWSPEYGIRHKVW